MCMYMVVFRMFLFLFKRKTAYEMRISDWSSDVCSSDLASIYLMGVADEIEGHVQSIAGGVEDRERAGTDGQLANVNPSFTWVRLAQRIPRSEDGSVGKERVSQCNSRGSPENLTKQTRKRLVHKRV